MNARGRMNKKGGKGISLPKRVGLEHFAYRRTRLGTLIGNMLKSDILRLASHRRILILKILTQPIPGVGVSGKKNFFTWRPMCGSEVRLVLNIFWPHHPYKGSSNISAIG